MDSFIFIVNTKREAKKKRAKKRISIILKRKFNRNVIDLNRKYR